MKKSLLLSAIALSALTAGAQDFTDFATVTFNGQPVENNQTIICKEGADYSEAGLGFWYKAEIKVENTDALARPVYAAYLYVNPTKEQVEADRALWGGPQLCYEGGAKLGGCDSNACLPAGDNDAGNGRAWVPAKGEGTLIWTPEVNVTPLTTVNNYRLMLVANDYDADAQSYEDCSDPFYINICFTQNGNDAVETVEFDENAPVEYYNLAGIRVQPDDAAKGILIKKQGAKVQKIAR